MREVFEVGGTVEGKRIGRKGGGRMGGASFRLKIWL